MLAGLHRTVGLPGAIVLGLGSMLGTGIFVSLGLVAEAAGALILPAIVIAAALALANARSSARLAAVHPISGGTYEYAFRELSPSVGFAAGWLFLLAKSASAATAALGLAGYVIRISSGGSPTPPGLGPPMPLALGLGSQTLLALGLVVLFTLLAAAGLRRSNQGNAVLVSVTLAGLGALVLWTARTWWVDGGLPAPSVVADERDTWFGLPAGLLEGTALMFVAFTGYGRLATLGEEVREPQHTIPRAVSWTVGLVTLLYLMVAAAAVTVLGTAGLAAATRSTGAPLLEVARRLPGPPPGLVPLVTLAAATALAGVVLNLVLGLSRVVLAMARRGDLPRVLAHVDEHSSSPRLAVGAAGTLITALTLVGDLYLTWSFSAFTVLVYYGITNLAALRLGPRLAPLPRWVPWASLLSCLALATQIEPHVMLAGTLLIALSLLLRAVFTGAAGRS